MARCPVIRDALPVAPEKEAQLAELATELAAVWLVEQWTPLGEQVDVEGDVAKVGRRERADP